MEHHRRSAHKGWKEGKMERGGRGNLTVCVRSLPLGSGQLYYMAPDTEEGCTGPSPAQLTTILGQQIAMGMGWHASALVSMGADIHADGESMLKIACARGNPDLAELLLSLGADIHAGGLILPFIFNAHLPGAPFSTAESLFRKGVSREAPLFVATGCGHEAMVSLLLSKGADAGAEGSGCLSLAAAGNFHGITERLLRAGADPLSRNGEAIALAGRYGHREIEALLLAVLSGTNMRVQADRSEVFP